MLTLHSLPSTKQKKKKRLGRGTASGKGNYAGRGMKGQRARSGGKGGLKLRGLKQSFMAVPKVRGFRSPHVRMQGVNLRQLNEKFDDGATITPTELLKTGLIRTVNAPVKILGQGALKKKVALTVHAVSKTAQEAITASGGTVAIIPFVRKKTVSKKKKSA